MIPQPRLQALSCRTAITLLRTTSACFLSLLRALDWATGESPGGVIQAKRNKPLSPSPSRFSSREAGRPWAACRTPLWPLDGGAEHNLFFNYYSIITQSNPRRSVVAVGGTAKGKDRWGEGEQQRARIEAMIRGPWGVPSPSALPVGIQVIKTASIYWGLA